MISKIVETKWTIEISRKMLLQMRYFVHRLGGEVSKVFPDVLLATMDIIHTQYKNLKGRDGYTFNTDEAKERVSTFGHFLAFLF